MTDFISRGLDASALAQAIVAGEGSCTQLMQSVLARIDAVNGDINAVCSFDAPWALQQAAQKDEELARLGTAQRAALLGEQPFFGVPSLLKDLGTADTRLPSTMGSGFFGQVKFAEEGDLVGRYKRAGLVFFGRSTSSELGLSPTTESSSYGAPTRNPWNRAHSAGGSSGGAGAAVAAGMVPIAHGGDGGGSIRIPAACCGLVGLKTSRGMTAFGPGKGESWGGMVSEHMLTVSVRDCALALDVAAGPSVGAPYAAPAFDRSFMAVVQAALAGPRRALRIGVVRQQDLPALDTAVAQAQALFAQRLRELGHTLVEVPFGFASHAVLEHVVPVIAQNAWASIEAHALRTGSTDFGSLQKTVRSLVDYARRMPASEYIGHVNGLHALGRRLAAYFIDQRIDLLALPVLAEQPAALGRFAMDWDDYEHYRLGADSLAQYSPFCPLANAAGTPAISLPCAMSEQGLPIGMQLLAPFGRDDTLIEVAAQYEHRFPWQRHAPQTRGPALD